MDREYDIFERFADGSVVWRGFVRGLDEARATVERLGRQAQNEFFAMYAPTRVVVARANAQKAASA